VRPEAVLPNTNVIAETEVSRQGDKSLDKKIQKPYPFSKGKVWHGLPGTLEVVYAQVKGLLDGKK
jgi:hypothetical protein